MSGNANDDPTEMPLDALDINPEDPKANSILMLDQEQINRLENVLSSEEAKNFLGGVLSNPDTDPNEGLESLINSSIAIPPEFADIGPPPPLIPNSEVIKESATITAAEEIKKGGGGNRRKSQRQIDRELKEEAERIRKENQEMEKKEKEALRRNSQNEEQQPPAIVPAATTTTGR